MIFREDNKIIIQGSVTVDNVVAMTKQGIASFDSNRLIVDLAKVAEVDSSIVSMLLEWLREAKHQGRQLTFVNMTGSLENLIQLYGISEFIPLGLTDVETV
jgi:phospholipid transport system transporter-binding protein